MRGSSSVGLGLSLVFGCLLLALVAELYYLIWWKKKANNRDIIQESYTSPVTESFYMFCCKKPSSLFTTGLTTDTQVHEPIWVRPFGQEQQVLRLQNMNLSVPPRFLFTIKEETKEDLESDDVSRRSLSDVGSVFFTPLASPPFLTPPITPVNYSFRAFSPLFQSTSDSEFNRIWASPPPKFKFLRDAEDKLQRKLMKVDDDDDDVEGIKDEEDGSYLCSS
ncbi:hypothetical protein HanPI659440_Chr12g0460901 [Helianthus annuus]|nr:hypothetical protein HanPI659440_Chr12g0460901 [Helianthus annuus]